MSSGSKPAIFVGGPRHGTWEMVPEQLDRYQVAVQPEMSITYPPSDEVLTPDTFWYRPETFECWRQAITIPFWVPEQWSAAEAQTQCWSYVLHAVHAYRPHDSRHLG